MYESLVKRVQEPAVPRRQIVALATGDFSWPLRRPPQMGIPSFIRDASDAVASPTDT